jgi:multidrug efflux pump subunit AcrA (membrane-fusion protein)
MNIPLRHKVIIGVMICIILIVLLLIVGCSKGKVSPPATSPPPEVEVVQVQKKDVPIFSEWVGTLDGMVNAEIWAQVAGYLLEQHYVEGSFVRKGQLIFEIDPRSFQAALDQARGDLARAERQVTQPMGSSREPPRNSRRLRRIRARPSSTWIALPLLPGRRPSPNRSSITPSQFFAFGRVAATRRLPRDQVGYAHLLPLT